MTHVWFWRNGAPRTKSAIDRKGQPCRILVPSSPNGNVLVEFEDGYRVVAPRHAVRRA